MNTHETYVSLEVAKLLKEVGFDWECSHWIGDDGSLWITDRETNNLSPENKERFLHCPSLAVAQKWLREVKGYYLGIVYSSLYEKWYVSLPNSLGQETILENDTYESALEAGIKKCLTLILEKDER